MVDSSKSHDPVNLRSATIYIAESRPAIVAAMHFNGAGIRYEQEEPLKVETDTIALGSAARAALGKFSFKEKNLGDSNKSDWPSYKASRCRTMREFESLYLRIEICALNSAELFYDAHAYPPGETDITLHITLNPHRNDEEIGQKIIKLFNACQSWCLPGPASEHDV